VEWALLASGQITMRKVDGWQTLAEKPTAAVPLDLAAWPEPTSPRRRRPAQAISTQPATAPVGSCPYF